MIISASQEALQKAISLLKSGKIIACKTDTVYALIADVKNENSVKKIYELKDREKHKPLQILCDKEEVAYKIGVFDKKTKKITKKHWPGALTVIVDKKTNQKIYGYNTEDYSVGIRVPKDDFLLKLINQLGGVVSATSANPSGKKDSLSAKNVEKYFSGKISLIIDGGSLPSESKPSTILDCRSDKIKLVRGDKIPT